MKKATLRVLRVLLLAYIGVLVMLMALERFMVYPSPPNEDGDWVAEEFGAEDVYFSASDGTKLHGWYIEHPSPTAHLLFCHGNGEHVGYLGTWLNGLSKRMDVSVFAFDYRGYGKSEGKPHQQGVLLDAEAAHRWLAERAAIQRNEVVVYGRSLGGSVAVHLASANGARALIAERTFHSMVEIGANQYPWVPIRWLMRNRYPAVDWIARYEGPFLQMHGTADRLVPLESARALHAACPSADKEFLEVDRMGHNDLSPPEFFARFERLVRSLSPLAP